MSVGIGGRMNRDERKGEQQFVRGNWGRKGRRGKGGLRSEGLESIAVEMSFLNRLLIIITTMSSMYHPCFCREIHLNSVKEIFIPIDGDKEKVSLTARFSLVTFSILDHWLHQLNVLPSTPFSTGNEAVGRGS